MLATTFIMYMHFQEVVVTRLMQLCKAVTSLLQGCIIVVAFCAKCTSITVQIHKYLIESCMYVYVLIVYGALML